MARYFFDVQDGETLRDEDGTECAHLQDAILEAKKLLPSIARDEVPKDGERQTVSVLVTDDDGQAIYSGVLTYTGSWLIR